MRQSSARRESDAVGAPRPPLRLVRPESAGSSPGSRAGVWQKALGWCGCRLALLAVVLLALGWTISGPLELRRHANETPFRVDYLAFDTGATIVRNRDAGDLYDAQLQHDVQAERTGNTGRPFTAYFNPPVVAAAFVPIASLSARDGYVAALTVLAAILLAAVALLYRLLDGAPRSMRWATTICVAGSTACASALMSGQLTPVLLLITFGALLAYRARRPEIAGVVLGLLFIKPHFAAAALVVLIIARQRKAAAYMCATLAAGLVASWLIVGNDGMAGYVSFMRESLLRPEDLFIDVRTEQNIRGLAGSLFDVYGGAPLTLASFAISAAVFVAVAVAIARSPYTGMERAHHVAALGAVLICAAAPHIQYYDLALLALPASFIVLRAAHADPAVRSRFYGVLVLTVLWVEAAGMVTGARISFSVIPILAFTAMFLTWPRVEAWLTRPNASETAATHAEPLQAQSA